MNELPEILHLDTAGTLRTVLATQRARQDFINALLKHYAFTGTDFALTESEQWIVRQYNLQVAAAEAAHRLEVSRLEDRRKSDTFLIRPKEGMTRQDTVLKG